MGYMDRRQMTSEASKKFLELTRKSKVEYTIRIKVSFDALKRAWRKLHPEPEYGDLTKDLLDHLKLDEISAGVDEDIDAEVKVSKW